MTDLYFIADQVRDLINASPEPLFPVEATTNIPSMEDGQRLALTVSVYPTNLESEPETRTSDAESTEISVGVQMHLDPEDKDSQVRALHRFVMSIKGIISDNRVLEGATLALVSADPLLDVRHLQERGLFTSVLRAEYDLC